MRHVRMEEGSWRDQLGRARAGSSARPQRLVRVPGDYSTDDESPPPPPYWIPPEPAHPDPSLQYLEATVAERPGDQRARPEPPGAGAGPGARRCGTTSRKSGIKALCLALSGGRDSAMVALLVARMYRYWHPDHAASRTEAAGRRAVRLRLPRDGELGPRHARRGGRRGRGVGATFLDGQIQRALDAAHEAVEAMTGETLSWSDPRHDITLQNIQARLRGMLIWTVANMHNALLLVTSNKSEAAVGYTTMDGDSSGGLAPIADVPKSLVKLYLAWARRSTACSGFERDGRDGGHRRASAARAAQTDEADLMPFPVLDQLMYAFVQLASTRSRCSAASGPRCSEYYDDDPAEFAAHIKKFVRLFCFAQWKRERFAISFRVTAFDLDPKTGFRFPPVQAPFTEELAEMDRLVDEGI